MTLAEIERKAIEMTLKKNKNNVAATAKELGIGRSTLFRKMKQFGLSKPETKPNENNGT